MARRSRRDPPYGPIKFLADGCMFFITGGLWAIWIIIRELRYR